MRMIDTKDLEIGVVEAARYLGIPESTLQRWTDSGYGPKCRRVGPKRMRRFRLGDLEEWRRQREEESRR